MEDELCTLCTRPAPARPARVRSRVSHAPQRTATAPCVHGVRARSYMFNTAPNFRTERVQIAVWNSDAVKYPSYVDVLYAPG